MANSNSGHLVAPADVLPEEWVAEAKMKNRLISEQGFSH